MKGSEGWDAAANDAYVAIIAPRLAHLSIDALLLSPPSKHHSILEVACGPGHLSIHAARIGINHVVATDWSPQMIYHLQNSLLKEAPVVQSRIKALVEDGQTLSSISDSSMDKIYSMFGLFLFAHVESGIKAAFRVLKPKGQLIFSFYLPDSDPPPSLTSVLKTVLDHMGASPYIEDKWKLSSEDYKALLLKNGFDKVEEVRVRHSLAFKDADEAVRSVMGRNPAFDDVLLNAPMEKLEECKRALSKHLCGDNGGPCSYSVLACFFIATKKADLID